MKYLKTFSTAFLIGALLLAGACSEDEPLPDIKVGFKAEPENPAAGEVVTFTNSSTGGTDFAWDFGDGETANVKDPTHTYTEAGDYTVTLTVDNNQNWTYSKTLTVGNPSPAIGYTPEAVEVGIDVTFTAEIYNPNNETVEWSWQFPVDQATADDMDENGVVTGETVTVRFTEPGDAINVTATAKMGSDEFSSTESVEVSDQLAKTLYIGQKDGNIWTKSIYLRGEAEMEDMGISAGAHPLTLDFENDRLYVFDAGEKITFSTESEATPGKIFSMSYDGTGYVTHITFGTASPYDDAFFGDVTSENIFFTDRRNDVTKIPLTTENAIWQTESGDANPDDFPALVANNQLGYYSAYRSDGGPTYGWGAVNGSFKVRDGVYWWAKNSNHRGIWRFTDDAIGATDVVPAEGSLLTDYAVRSFEIDEENQKIYFASNNGLARGFFVADLDGSNVTLIDDAPYDGEGGENEPTFITGIELDIESGYVYWAYRGPDAQGSDGEGNPIPVDYEQNPLWRSGVKMYKLDGTGEVEYFVQDVEAYGLAIDHTKR